jgi:hypothetical protein
LNPEKAQGRILGLAASVKRPVFPDFLGAEQNEEKH